MTGESWRVIPGHWSWKAFGAWLSFILIVDIVLVSLAFRPQTTTESGKDDSAISATIVMPKSDVPVAKQPQGAQDQPSPAQPGNFQPQEEGTLQPTPTGRPALQ